jgi:hypothetical protein
MVLTEKQGELNSLLQQSLLGRAKHWGEAIPCFSASWGCPKTNDMSLNAAQRGEESPT